MTYFGKFLNDVFTMFWLQRLALLVRPYSFSHIYSILFGFSNPIILCAVDTRSWTVAYLSTMFSLLQENSRRSTGPLAYPVLNPWPPPSTGPRRSIVSLAYPVPNPWPPPSTGPRRSFVSLAYPVPNHWPPPSTRSRRSTGPLAYPVLNPWPPPSTRPRRSTVYTPSLSFPQPLAPS